MWGPRPVSLGAKGGCWERVGVSVRGRTRVDKTSDPRTPLGSLVGSISQVVKSGLSHPAGTPCPGAVLTCPVPYILWVGASRAGGRLRAGHRVAPRRAAPGHRAAAGGRLRAGHRAAPHVALCRAIGGCLMAVGVWWWPCCLCWPLSRAMWPSRAEPLELPAVRETIGRETIVIMGVGPRVPRAAGAVIALCSSA